MLESRCIIGCCGWTQAQARYFANFGAIEIQTTFYDPPSRPVAQRWKSSAPPGFVFCMKAWQLITHTPASPTYRRLKSPVSPSENDLYGFFRPTEQVALAWERTREIADALDARVVLFQCPKSFLPTPANLRNLAEFFRSTDRAGRIFAWEPRGVDWTPALVRDLCAAHNLVHCVDPFYAAPLTTGITYFRLHGRGTYRYQYTDADLAELGRILQPRVQLPGPHYVMFNNMTSAADAQRFQVGYLQARSGRKAL